MAMTLLQDIFSMFHDKKGPVKLGQRGEQVRLISDHGNVLIVEGKKGKFTVNINQIKYETNENATGAIQVPY